MLAQLISRAGHTWRTQQEKQELQELWVAGDAQRKALMDASKMLAQHLDMNVLFSSVMVRAKELMEVDRSTLFMVAAHKGVMYTLVADGAPPITINIGKGLAGACAQAKQLVNVPDAYKDARFNPAVDLKSGYLTRCVLCVPILNSRDEVIAVIQLINKLNGLRFGRPDEELAGVRAAQPPSHTPPNQARTRTLTAVLPRVSVGKAFAAQLAVSIENLRGLEDVNMSLKAARIEEQRLSRQLISCRELVTHTDTPLAVCRRVREYAADFTSSMSAALLLNTDHKVGRGIAYRTLGGQALERAVSHLLLAEPPEDVRHPPMVDLIVAAMLNEGGDTPGMARRRSSTKLGELAPDLVLTQLLLRQNTSRLANPGRRRSSACATLSVRNLADSRRDSEAKPEDDVLGQFEVLYGGSPLVELCHEAIRDARPVRRSIVEPCREVTEATSLGAVPDPVAGVEDAAWVGDGTPPPPGRQVLAMAVPISVPISVARQVPPPKKSDGDDGEAENERAGEVAAVLVVWERRPDPLVEATGCATQPYNAADEQILRTLAALAGHLLLQVPRSRAPPTHHLNATHMHAPCIPAYARLAPHPLGCVRMTCTRLRRVGRTRR